MDLEPQGTLMTLLKIDMLINGLFWTNHESVSPNLQISRRASDASHQRTSSLQVHR